MKVSLITMPCLVVLATLVATAQATIVGASPLQKVIEMLGKLEMEVTMEGKAADAAHEEFQAWCKDRLANLGYDISTGKKEISEDEATIESESATIASSKTKVEEVAAQMATDEGDLAAAMKVRETEAADFDAEEKELKDTISTMERAIAVLKQEMSKGGAALVQIQKIGTNIAKALSTLVDAALLNSRDAAKLTAFVQATQSDDDEEYGAPAAPVYESHSASIVEVLEDLYQKATDNLAELQKKEVTSKHNFEMMKQGLVDAMKFAEEDISATKKALAAAQEAKAAAEGDLAMATKKLKVDEEDEASTSQECEQKAADYVAEKKSRSEELAALAEAKQVLTEATGAAAAQTYDFTQIHSADGSDSVMVSNRADLINFEAVRFVRDLAKKFNNDQALTQLAMRMSGAMRTGRSAADPFVKVRELIKGMIEKLLKDASADASHKAFCDKELGDSATKKEQLSTTIDKLSTKIDKMSAKSTQLKDQVADLQKQLSALASSSAEMAEIRSKEKAAFAKAKAELTEGVEGVEQALKILREYYAQDTAHDASSDAGNGIISLLEVVQSDFTKGLSERTVAEQQAADEYDKQTKEDAITKATMEQDVKYKTKESKSLDSEVTSLSSDLSGAKSEYEAVLEYTSKLNAGCISKPMTYAERDARRESMIAGLKEALQILDSASFVQKKSFLRTAHLHVLSN